MKWNSQSIPLHGLMAAEFLSLLGNQIAAVAIPLIVLQFTHSPMAAGVAGAGNVLPILFAALIGGKVIDTFGALWASITADLMSFVSVLCLPLVLINFSDVSPIVLFVLVFIGALFDPTGVSARQALVPSLARLSRVSLVKINGYRGALENGADLAGPIVGTTLFSLIGAANTFFLNALSFLVCATILYFCIRRKKRKPSKFRRLTKEEGSLFQGVRFILANPSLRAMALVGMVANFVVLPFLGLLLPVLVTQKFGDPMILGVILSVFGLAATFGALGFSRLAERISRSMIYYGGLVVTALSIGASALVETPFGVIVSAAFAGLLLGASNPLEQTIFQEQVPRKIAGQVFTSQNALRFLGGPLGLLLAGIAVEFLGVDWGLLAGAAILFFSTLLGMFVAPLKNL